MAALSCLFSVAGRFMLYEFAVPHIRLYRKCATYPKPTQCSVVLPCPDTLGPWPFCELGVALRISSLAPQPRVWSCVEGVD